MDKVSGTDNVLRDKIPEEVDEILKIGKKEIGVRKPENKKEVSETTVASILFFIGIAIMVIAFIVGMVLGQPEKYSNGDANTKIMFICWGTGFISGMTFIGFAEVIKLLQKVSDK